MLPAEAPWLRRGMVDADVAFAAASLPLGDPRTLPLLPPLPLAAAELLLPLLPPVVVVVVVSFTVVALTIMPEGDGGIAGARPLLPDAAPEALAPRCKKFASRLTARFVRGWWSPRVKRNSCTAITTTASASAPFSLLLPLVLL